MAYDAGHDKPDTPTPDPAADMTEIDFLVIGGGMAGVSAAACLAPKGRTLLLERETALGTHATGRSAAMFYQNYGAAPVRALSRASLPFYLAPPTGFGPTPLLKRTGVLTTALPEDEALFEAYLADPDRATAARFISPAEACAKVSILYPDRVSKALFEADAYDLEVDLILQGFRRQARAAGAELRTGAEALAIERDAPGGWRVETEAGEIRAQVLINAAGAWADTVAQRAGVAPLGVAPKRRTAFTVPLPRGVDTRGWPMVVDVRESYYFKPDAGAMLISLADEAESEPCDAWACDEDVALAVERVQQVAALPVPRVISQWAGLRSFAPDRVVVVGFDPAASGFFWLAGQGGYGIQTAPAMSRLCAALASREAVPDDLVEAGLDLRAVSPTRFRAGAGQT